MGTTYITVTVKIKVSSNLNINDLLEEFNQNTDYKFNSTENVQVLTTEIIEVI